MAAVHEDGFFFANKGEINIAGENDTPAALGGTGLAVVKDIEIDASSEHVPLWGWGSIRRVAVARHSGKVSVKIGYMKFNPAASTILAYIMNPLGTSAGAMEYTNVNDVKLFVVTFKITNEDGDVLTGTVHDVYFPGFPMKASEGQWMKMDLSGEGSYISWA